MSSLLSIAVSDHTHVVASVPPLKFATQTLSAPPRQQRLDHHLPTANGMDRGTPGGVVDRVEGAGLHESWRRQMITRA